MQTESNALELIQKIGKDLKNASVTLSDTEARYLVDYYYAMQDFRIQANNQLRPMKPHKDATEEQIARAEAYNAEPHEVIAHFSENFSVLEQNIKKALDIYSESSEIGRWMKSICGIGPVIAAGLLSSIDIKKVETAGSIQKYCGLCPGADRPVKGTKLPYNKTLKTLAYKIGESFVKVQNNPNDIYGKIYAVRKAYEQEKNERGDYADQAAEALAKKNYRKETDAYKWYSEGKLPPAHIHRRCARYAVKIFLSNLFEVWYMIDRGAEAPKPFAIAILNHAHEIHAPGIEEIRAKYLKTA